MPDAKLSPVFPASHLPSADRAASPPSSNATTALRLRAAIWLLVLSFLVTGVFGRFPWKADEPYSFGIIQEILEGGHWLVPHVAAQSFLEKPPLVYWLGAISARLFPFAPTHESSRIALLTLVGVTLFALYRSAWLLWPETVRWRQSRDLHPITNKRAFGSDSRPDYALLAILLFVGTLGFTEQIHKLTADIGQLAGCTIALAGLIRLGTAASTVGAGESGRAMASGAIIGMGVGIGFLSKGLLVPGLIALTWLACLSQPAYRRTKARWAALAALMSSLPWLLIWPLLLHRASPDLFHEWLWDNNVGRFFGAVNLGGIGVPLIDKVASLTLASFPALPLACTVAIGALRRARGVAEGRLAAAPGHVCVAIFAAVSLTILFASASFRDNYLLPLLPALILLGLPALSLPAGRLASLSERWGKVLFAIAALVPIVLWLQLVTTGTVQPAALRSAIAQVLPLPYDLSFNLSSVLVVVSVLLLWAFVIQKDEFRGFVATWCAGIAMLWTLIFALLLPWIDAARSYQGVFTDMRAQLLDSDCLVTSNLGESELAMVDYVTGKKITRLHPSRSGSGDPSRFNPAAEECDWLLVLSHGASQDPLSGWTNVWQGSRPGDARERFDLYARTVHEASFRQQQEKFASAPLARKRLRGEKRRNQS